mmetsp:Transcript_32599/g.49890  ORF Transcript_32599/g.49890 Transcript_32599/m.49890 type:complete len:148 (-) Transcript_32599:219-662(-)
MDPASTTTRKQAKPMKKFLSKRLSLRRLNPSKPTTTTGITKLPMSPKSMPPSILRNKNAKKAPPAPVESIAAVEPRHSFYRRNSGSNITSLDRDDGRRSSRRSIRPHQREFFNRGRSNSDPRLPVHEMRDIYDEWMSQNLLPISMRD